MLVKHKWIVTLGTAAVLTGVYTGHRLVQAADIVGVGASASGPALLPARPGGPMSSAVDHKDLGDSTAPTTPANTATLSNVFHDVQKCRAAATELAIDQTVIDRCEAKKADAAGYRLCSAEVAASARAMQAATARQAYCTADPVALDRQYYKAVDAAAKAGDLDAQVCFANGNFDLTDKDEISRYTADARAYLQAGLARGDWRVVALLATPVESLNHGGGMMASLPMMGSQFTAYRANRLLQYAAKGSYAQSVKQDADEAAQQLAPAQIANANAWAVQEYQRYFSKSPDLAAAPTPCQTPSS